MAGERVLIVEDDEVTALHLKMALEKMQYDVVSVASSTLQARNKIKIYEPQVVIIDIALQEYDDGIMIANFLKENFPIPFIYLSSHTEVELIDKAKLTQPYGYIVKPFVIESLHTTIQMALYRFQEEEKRNRELKQLTIEKLDLEKLLFAKKDAHKPQVDFCTHFYLDLNTNETYYKGKKVRLTQKENLLMVLLVAQKNSTVTFEQAMSYVWKEEGATENSIRTLVWRLRAKLPEDIIQNVSGVGYTIED
ncbi:MAG: transcriptional regulator [Sulfuricurvum sp. PC08-66]|nr:MAG: transcriptional regulator [Sulfuricurvum sp. PC08-66]